MLTIRLTNSLRITLLGSTKADEQVLSIGTIGRGEIRPEFRRLPQTADGTTRSVS